MPENYILLERTELNASAASVTFANIPQSGYTDLKIVVSARTDNANNAVYLVTEFNGVSSGYTTRDLYGTGSAVASRALVNSNSPLIPGSTSTASTFGNMEIYIPNYTSSNFKSYSADSVTENNATLAFQALSAILWSNTAAITSIKLTPELGSLIAGSTFSLYGIAAVGTTPAIAPKASGGNIIDFDGTNWIHIFTSSGTFTPQTGLTCDYLIVAGGGGGGRAAGGGGGAGGYKTTIGGSTISASVQNYNVVVGAGGVGQIAGALPTASKGTDSSFAGVTSTGGGGGGGYNGDNTPTNTTVGANGGSGGGSFSNSAAGSASPSGEGNNGGVGRVGAGYGEATGGGGGAGAVGQSSPSTGFSGNGGAGLANSISGTSVTYAGGGGGAYGSYNYGSQSAGTGGSGGGGAGGTGIGSSGTGTINGANGTANRGGGGGGGAYSGTLTTLGTAGAGGSGIVIIRYPAA
jgi:hypothetical protein